MNKEQRRKYYLKNRDRILTNQKRYVENHREKVKNDKRKWQEKNRERLKKYGKRWREKNPEKIKEFTKRYYSRPDIKQQKLEYNRQYRKNHPRKDYQHKKKLRFEILKRDNFTCQYCGRKAPNVELQIDHIQPLSEDGERYKKENLITACSDCNQGKGDVLLSELKVV